MPHMEHGTFSKASILEGLATTVLPRHVLYYLQVSSTMDIARERLRHGSADEFPLLVVTDEQTAGRGRQKRVWMAPAQSALLFSLALRPTWLASVNAQALVWMASVSVCEGIAHETGLTPRLKWPNDVLIPYMDGALGKAAGILLELSSSAAIDWAIIGCGINVSASPGAEIASIYPPTHIMSTLDRPVSRLALLQAVVRRMDFWLQALQRGERNQLYAIWRKLLITIGQEVQVQTASGIVSGRAEDVDILGSLYVRDADGILHVVMTGDVF